MNTSKIQQRVSELIPKIRPEVMPAHRLRCEEREKLYPLSVRFDDEISRMLQSNSLVAELRRLQRICSHIWTDWEDDTTWSIAAKTKRCTICSSNETIFDKGEENEPKVS